nr:MAG TPA: replicative helicase [Caudoviricetes sp.]
MQTEVTDIKNLINQRMTNIIKKRTEQTTEKTGISFVETVDISGLWRKETIAKYKKLSEKMMCDDDYGCSFENSYAKSKTEKAYKKSFERFCKNFVNFKHEGLGIYISGEVGAGKSHYTNCIYNSLKDDFIVYKTSIMTLFDEIIETFGEKTATSFLRERLGDAELIIIEDLGNESIKDWGKQNLYFIIDFIFREKKSVIINTNLTDKQMEEFLKILGSNKLLSRLQCKCKYYKFDWEDRRIGMYKEEIEKWY